MLLCATVALMVFEPWKPDLDTYVDAAPRNAAQAGPVTSAGNAVTGTPAMSAAETPVVAPASAPAGLQPPVASAPAPRLQSVQLEVIAPPRAPIGSTIQIIVVIAGGSAASAVEVVLEYEEAFLQTADARQGEPGRAKATMQSAGAEHEFVPAVFEFLVVAPELRATSVTATAQAFNEAGSLIQVVPPPRQEIVIDP